VDATGAVRADYRYTTYGERTRAAGDLDTDWGYAGLWHHAPSGLDLATHRIYDSTRGRWLSRDPLGEGTDRTLYSYSWNSPINFIDPLGLYKDQDGQVEKNCPGFKKAHELAKEKLRKRLEIDDSELLRRILMVLEDESLEYRYNPYGPQTVREAQESRGSHNYMETLPRDFRRINGNPDITVNAVSRGLNSSDLSNIIIHEAGHMVQDHFSNSNAASPDPDLRNHPPEVFDYLENWFSTGAL
jgi:RHS repeat-associated protein